MRDDPDRYAERQVMLDDIQALVGLTRGHTGVASLASSVLEAMRRVPRHRFVPDHLQDLAYADGPLPIGHGQTISQPFIVALMTQLLAVDAHARVLEVGTGCGYQCAVLAELAREVFSIELVEPLARAAAARLAALGYENLQVRQGDGYLGWPEQAPFDGILVTAAAPHVPQPLVEQLRPGANLVIPVDRGFGQQLVVLRKRDDGGVDARDVLPVAFVPLLRA